MVNTISLGYRTPAQAFLTQSLIPLEDPRLNQIPTAAVTALMPTLTRLIIAPPFTSMLTTESAGISRCIAAAAFTAGFRRAGRHGPGPCWSEQTILFAPCLFAAMDAA